jgi:hypothetical protein
MGFEPDLFFSFLKFDQKTTNKKMHDFKKKPEYQIKLQ